MANMDRSGSQMALSSSNKYNNIYNSNHNSNISKLKPNPTSLTNQLSQQAQTGYNNLASTENQNSSLKFKNRKELYTSQQQQQIAGGMAQNHQLNSPCFMNQATSRSNSHMNSSFNQAPGDLRSDLRKDWLEQELLVSHCAINQITHTLLQKRKEIKLLKFYNQPDQHQKQTEFIQLRKKITKYFEDHKTIEKRLQKYQLMADDVGLQSGLFLLLTLSDDEIKGISNDPQLNTHSEYKSSISSGSSDRGKGTSILSQTSKYMKKYEKKKIQKEFKTGWFRKNINYLINTIDSVLSDHSFSLNSSRIAIILLSNLHFISKSATKSYTKKKTTFNKFLKIFELNRDLLNEEELIEIEKALMYFYSKREIFQVTKRSYFQYKKKDSQPYQFITDNEPFRPKKLIRSDSVESLIEQINTEQQYRQMMQGNQLDLSNVLTHTDNNDDTGKQQLNSYEFRMLAEDRTFDRQLSPHESNDMEFNQQVRTTGSVGNDMKNIIMRAMANRKHKQPSQFNGSRSPELTTSNNNSVISKLDDIKYKSNYYQILYTKNQSKYSKRNFNNDSNLKDSRICGSPIADTFIDFKDSLIARDKSFYQKYMMDQSREDFKQYHGAEAGRPNNDSITFTKNSSAYNNNSQFQSGPRRPTYNEGTSQGQTFKDKLSLGKNTLSKDTPEIQEYENLDLKTVLKNTQQSTQIDKKYLSGNLEKSLNKNSKIYATSNQGCCACFGISKQSERRSTLKNTALLTRQSEEYKGSILNYQRISVKDSVKEQIRVNRQALQLTSDYSKSILCPHNKNFSLGEKCKKCSSTKKINKMLSSQDTSNQGESCAIF
ncbi:UNKNOWN [Stylonychia lemnae]|uniref:Uncharacterized protein n=1 Tax=Stylonychia lemnae TaxID=5949 RepID=A0A078ARN3_STYLE|nr:UNKNOWN [Stylonychia lemnae]|eukprot:CDW83867.1 UNKNOWN [Stylonychia lemnae]